jgi:hypothetical protein
MKIFLAYGNMERELRYREGILAPVNNWLFSYAFVHQKEFQEVMTFFHSAKTDNREKHLLIDSGAFTVYNTGVPINVKDYGEWLLSTKKHWAHRVTGIEYMTLDVIGDQRQTERNTAYLESLGLNPIYVLTINSSDDDIRLALKKYTYLAIGGFNQVGLKERLARLNHFFGIWEQHRKETGEAVKTHLLGLCREDILYRYPAFSCDMTTWFIATKSYGRIPSNLKTFKQIKRLPKMKRSVGTFAATVTTIIDAINYYQELEKDVTKAWEQRGITWNTK